jgi:hypothetical protein
VSIQKTFKPRDVEEPVDYWVNRPLASILVKALAPLPVTPNQVTIASGIVGLVAGAVLATAPLDSRWQAPLAGALLYVSILLDCADGQLARLRGQSSLVGRFLDGVVDVGPIGAIFLGFAILHYRFGYNFWLINVVGWAAGYSMKVHVHGYDHAKNLFLANTRPEDQRKSAMPTPAEIAAERDKLLAKGDRFGAWTLSGFITFTEAQRRGWQARRIGIGLAGARTDEQRAIYRDRFGPTMLLWRWNGLGTHHIFLVGSCFITPYFHEAFAMSCFFFLGPMNALTAYTVWKEKAVERELQIAFASETAAKAG